MRTILGTRVLGARSRKTYLCERCGIERPMAWDKTRGRMCMDCRWVTAKEKVA